MTRFVKAHPYWGLLYLQPQEFTAVRRLMQDGAEPDAIEDHIRSLAGEEFYDRQFAELRDSHPARLARLIDENQSPVDIEREKRMGKLMNELAPVPKVRQRTLRAA